MRFAILLFAIWNASLYSALLPLWEGFDEAFHYGYVETLWQTSRFPVLGKTMVPDDVANSFRFAPVSHVVHAEIPQAASYDVYFALPEAEKTRRRSELEHLQPQFGFGSGPNYEAHQPPLAYLLSAPLDSLMSRFPITSRVLFLRLFGAVSSTLLLFFGATALCRTFGMPEPFATAALLTIFCSQMLYATVAHVANDWLAVGLSACFVASLAKLVKTPDRRWAWTTAGWLSAGLVTKAYFLVLLALALGVAMVLVLRRRVGLTTMIGPAALVAVTAGPWYVRNLLLYGNVSGTQEQFGGIGMRESLAAATHMDWLTTSAFIARGSLWTGNNSFTSYSRTTLNLMLGLLFLSLVMWGVRRLMIQAAERAMFATVVTFSLAIAYASCASFAYTRGISPGASPWYTQVLLAPVLALSYLGMSRWQRAGRILAALSIVIWAWVLMSTWTIKLFPLYSGADTAPLRMPDIWRWYRYGAAAHAGDLSLTALAPAPLLYAGLIVSVILTIGLSAAVILALVTRYPHLRCQTQIRPSIAPSPKASPPV